MLDIRQRIILIASFGLAIFIAIIFLLFRKPITPENTPVNPETNLSGTTASGNNNAGVSAPGIETPPPPPGTPEAREKLYVVQLSKIFVERYLSYSNQNENNHISDVATLATPLMVQYLATQKQQYSVDYKGVSTKVISSSLETFASGKATVTVGAQQFLEEKNKPGVTAYKNGKVNLVKLENSWKVDGLYWE